MKGVMHLSIASYIALDGFWIVMTIMYIFINIKSIKHPGKNGEIVAICSVLCASRIL